MSDDEPVNVDADVNTTRITVLEQRLDGMDSKADATHKLLQTLMQSMGVTAPTSSAPPTTKPPPPRRNSSRHSDTTSAGRKKLSLKPSTPSEFDGDRTKGKAFLTSCRTYIRLCPEAFDDEVQQIIWAMSYMKAGRAGRWAAREFELEAEKGKLRFREWSDFEDEFRKDFTPLNEEVEAVNILETSAYHQGRKSVDDYLDRFRDLIHDSGYTDPKTVVVKFRRGLDRTISSALAGMTTGRPSDTDPEAWFRLAVQMDQNRVADQAFYSPQRTTALAPAPSRPGLLSRPPPPLPPARVTPAAPPLSMGVPMDIDAMRKSRSLPDTCRRCGAPGHWAKDCPHRFDVRHMDVDELQTLLEDRLAEKDAAPAEPLVVEADETPICTEDFVSSSG